MRGSSVSQRWQQFMPWEPEAEAPMQPVAQEPRWPDPVASEPQSASLPGDGGLSRPDGPSPWGQSLHWGNSNLQPQQPFQIGEAFNGRSAFDQRPREDSAWSAFPAAGGQLQPSMFDPMSGTGGCSAGFPQSFPIPQGPPSSFAPPYGNVNPAAQSGGPPPMPPLAPQSMWPGGGPSPPGGPPGGSGGGGG